MATKGKEGVVTGADMAVVVEGLKTDLGLPLR